MNKKSSSASSSSRKDGFSYKNLIVWQKAMEFARLAYPLARRFPDIERFGLADQVRRSSVSVASNIAEGSGRSSNRDDYGHFLAIARGSLYETLTQLELAKSFGYIEAFDDLESLAEEISRMLMALIKKYAVPLSNSNSRSTSNLTTSERES